MDIKKCVHMITEPARLAKILVDLGKISPRRDENFPCEYSILVNRDEILITHAQFKKIRSRDVNKLATG